MIKVNLKFSNTSLTTEDVKVIKKLAFRHYLVFNVVMNDNIRI